MKKNIEITFQEQILYQNTINLYRSKTKLGTKNLSNLQIILPAPKK